MSVLATAVAVASGLTFSMAAQAQLEEVIVVAQKRAENLQDVPIAVTAFDSTQLEAKQITNVADVRYTAPNVTFTKDNFTGSNFKIRGIGSDLITAGGDLGVGIHVNEVPLQQPRIFQTEYYDLEQLVILRGPQGTLYGRNSTGGAVNMITNRANPDEFEANLEGQFGNYDHIRLKGMVNIPFGDNFAVRLAGIGLQRDGYTENIYTGNDIDDRDQYSLRASAQWFMTEDTTINFMVSYMDEDSSRTRSQKQLCHNDPSGLLGCLPDKLAFETVNQTAQVTSTLAAALGPLGPVPGFSNEARFNPRDMRKVNAQTDPSYKMDETLAMIRLEHDFDEHSLTLMGSYHTTDLVSNQDFNMAASDTEFFPSPLLEFIAPVTHATYFADNTLPISSTSGNNTGSVGGNIARFTNTMEVYDESANSADEYSLEANFASEYDGRFNFMVGAFYLNYELEDDYIVLGTGLDYFALVFPAVPIALGGAIGADGLGWVSPAFHNTTEKYELDSQAVFGEAYYDLNDTLKLTVGLRYTDDEKTIRDAALFLASDANGIPVLQPFGADLPYGDQAVSREDTQSWQETTGRVVLEWMPEFNWSDQTMFYASYSRGYKGGGFNAPFDEQEFPNISKTFEPEYVDAFEVGTKNQLFDDTLQANVTGFYYDYEGYQVSKLVDRTAFTENTDAEIYGLEAEFIFAPTANWLFNANLAYLKTEIKDFASSDPRDPTQGRSDVTLLKDSFSASNCVVLHNGAPAPDMPGFNSCSAPVLSDGSPLPEPYTLDGGVAVDLSGNALSNSPEYTISAGGQYTWPLNSVDVTLRVDYYWQDEMYGRIYNRPIDKIDSFQIWNAQLSIDSQDDTWYARAYVKNIGDEDDTVGMYASDASAGLFTNVFLVEPRLYGVTLGYNF
ncbi:TonB-dependent receptor [Pseudohalioglobus sediminis]|uniref:TonB-dependent receptor n=1 Tax=Pseudohalioglobus sediminis TaxID=2606449 RepID=A0A5B0X2G3_9GAMM|nr:TonB-dependent receptor [Pseudohalioglobus sediminis]KAA1192501.1 TonB-dependent receptor [Pseudohalioglobus sediminis]